MRLLKRDNSGGISFTKALSDSVRPSYKYAILSHTWGPDEEEITYDEVINDLALSKPGLGSEKIRFCIRQTACDDLEYFWLDTCCINKRDSSELSESLISMYRWYADAERCYVFLSDVQQEEPGQKDWERQFRSSRWFERGWTLQELIAPPTIEFFSRQGTSIGTRDSMGKLICEITRIPVSGLCCGKSLRNFTIHERLQWQEGRETRKPEDMVYSLLGLLEVSMPVLYGEGLVRAKERLEIAINETQRGKLYKDFSLAFSLAEATVETQYFVAREKELQEISEGLNSDGSRKIVVLHGLGGIGKTQLAVRYAKQYRDKYSALFWLNAQDEGSILSSFAMMAKQILREHASPRLASLDPQNMAEVTDAVKSWLSTPMNTRWLMICDNYDNPRVPGKTDQRSFELRRYLPEAYQGSILVTTRSSWVRLGRCIQITKLESLQDGLELLVSSSDRRDLINDNSAVQLARKLDGLPLALATAGAYLRQSSISFTKYLHLLDESWMRLQTLSPGLITYEYRTLSTTWQVSYEQVLQRNRLSGNLLRLWAFFDNNDLWFELLSHSSDESPEWMQELTHDELSFEFAVQILCEHGLVQVDPASSEDGDPRGYSIHACLHSWVLASLVSGEHDELAQLALRCVALHIPDESLPDWSVVQRRLIKHANRCTHNIQSGLTVKANMGWAFHQLGKLYAYHDELGDAEKMYDLALQCKSRDLGPADVSTLNTVNNLGLLYQQQEKMSNAEKMLQQALNGYTTALGPYHGLTLNAVNNLGFLYANQGKIELAEDMYRRVLEGDEEAPGMDTISMFGATNNLGLVYSSHGKSKEARRMYDRALEGFVRTLGPRHTSTFDVLNNLGLLYSNEGKMVDAENMYTRALEGYEKAFGPSHSSTLKTLNNLGVVQKKRGRVQAAEESFQQILTRWPPTPRPHDKIIAQAVQDLIVLYAEQGKTREAEDLYMQRKFKGHEGITRPEHKSVLYSSGRGHPCSSVGGNVREALRLLEETVGPEHITTIDQAKAFGDKYRLYGELSSAEEMYVRALSGYQKVLGSMDGKTLDTAMCLGGIYLERNHLAQAEEVFEQALTWYKQALGKDDPRTLEVMTKLGIVYGNQGRLLQAGKFYEAGGNPTHLGRFYWAQGNMAGAEEMHRQVLKNQEQSMGRGYWANVSVLEELGYICKSQGKLEDAEHYYFRALEVVASASLVHATQCSHVMFNLCLLYVAQGKTELADEVYQQALDLERWRPSGRLQLSRTWKGDKKAVYAMPSRDNIDIIEKLLRGGADVFDGHISGKCKERTLCVASSQGHRKVVELLLELKAELCPESGIFGKCDALHAASSEGHIEIMKLLLAHAGHPSLEGHIHAKNALYVAISRGFVEGVRLLLNHGASVNLKGGLYGRNALYIASSEGHDEVVKLLLHHNAELNVGGEEYSKALQAAVSGGHAGIVELLTKRGA